MDNKILASAIKFHINKTDKDIILCGGRHADIYMQLYCLGFKPQEGYEELAQGFITSNGGFITREEAAMLVGSLKKELLSEDLW